MKESQRTGFRAAAAQLTSTDNLEANLAKCRELAKASADAGAALLVLPECFAFLGQTEADKRQVAECLVPASPGPILSSLMEIATTHKLWVIGGGMPVRPDDVQIGELPTQVHNAAVVVSPSGELTARYDKIHLFDIDIPGRAQFRESDSTRGGKQVVVAETPLARIGLTICYDLRFPELFQALSLSHGAELIVVPAAFTAHTGAAHWHALLRARAIETQTYVIAAAQWGRHNEKRETFGHTMIIDPWGRIVSELETGTGTCVADIDLALLDKTRAEMPCRQHHVLTFPE